MPKLRDPDQRAAERRAQILEEAVRVFGEKGYHATNIADIAAALGLGHGTFYRYFKNKLAIFDAVIDGIILAIGDLVTAESPTSAETLEDYRAQLRRIGERFHAIFASNERLARVFLYEALVVDAEIAGKMRTVMERLAKHTQAYLENGKKRGFLRADLDTHVTARAVNAMILESIHHVARDRASSRAALRWQDAIIRLMLDGMAAR
jgi:AcrR family transcriptional regulator